eukprot:GHVS01102831.1.p1 GENE.GHVS01102831.1~~GHVS01102831.1.p1  ORF type:complete len:109 (+),score=7.15 GHVS01102831.1:267-593(+)
MKLEVRRQSSSSRVAPISFSCSDASGCRIRVTGLTKAFLKMLHDGILFGRTKVQQANSSSKLFCRGVPVRMILREETSEQSFFDVSELTLFKRCPSSQTRRSKLHLTS